VFDHKFKIEGSVQLAWKPSQSSIYCTSICNQQDPPHYNFDWTF